MAPTAPTVAPAAPTAAPSSAPTAAPTGAAPTVGPTAAPSAAPTQAPAGNPTAAPTSGGNFNPADGEAAAMSLTVVWRQDLQPKLGAHSLTRTLPYGACLGATSQMLAAAWQRLETTLCSTYAEPVSRSDGAAGAEERDQQRGQHQRAGQLDSGRKPVQQLGRRVLRPERRCHLPVSLLAAGSGAQLRPEAHRDSELTCRALKDGMLICCERRLLGR